MELEAGPQHVPFPIHALIHGQDRGKVGCSDWFDEQWEDVADAGNSHHNPVAAPDGREVGC